MRSIKDLPVCQAGQLHPSPTVLLSHPVFQRCRLSLVCPVCPAIPVCLAFQVVRPVPESQAVPSRLEVRADLQWWLWESHRRPSPCPSTTWHHDRPSIPSFRADQVCPALPARHLHQGLRLAPVFPPVLRYRPIPEALALLGVPRVPLALAHLALPVISRFTLIYKLFAKIAGFLASDSVNGLLLKE